MGRWFVSHRLPWFVNITKTLDNLGVEFVEAEIFNGQKEITKARAELALVMHDNFDFKVGISIMEIRWRTDRSEEPRYIGIHSTLP